MNRLLYTDDANESDLHSLIADLDWQINIVGYISRNELSSDVIRTEHILPQNSLLNGHTKMDAENYYVQAGDLHPMSELIRFIRSRRYDIFLDSDQP